MHKGITSSNSRISVTWSAVPHLLIWFRVLVNGAAALTYDSTQGNFFQVSILLSIHPFIRPSVHPFELDH